MALSFVTYNTAMLQLMLEVRPVTVMCWAQHIANGNDFNVMFALSNDGSPPFLAMARTSASFNIYDGNAYNLGASYPLNTWAHCAMTWAGTSGDTALLGYFNGALSVSATSFSGAFSDRIHVGNYSSPSSSRLRGHLAAVKVWDTVLTEREIAIEMQCYLPFRTTNLVACTPGLVTEEAATNYYGTSWTVYNTIETELGPPITWSIASRYRAYAISVGGTVFTQTLNAAMTPIGGVVKMVRGVKSGNVTPIGVSVKRVLRAFGGNVSNIGSVVKVARKVHVGVMTPIGVLANIAVHVIALAGALSPVGTLSKRVSKSFIGSITPVGGVVKRGSKVLSAALAMGGGVVKRVGKVLSGGMIPIGTLLPGAIRRITLSGVLSSIGGVVTMFIDGGGVIVDTAKSMYPRFRRRRR